MSARGGCRGGWQRRRRSPPAALRPRPEEAEVVHSSHGVSATTVTAEAARLSLQFVARRRSPGQQDSEFHEAAGAVSDEEDAGAKDRVGGRVGGGETRWSPKRPARGPAARKGSPRRSAVLTTQDRRHIEQQSMPEPNRRHDSRAPAPSPATARKRRCVQLFAIYLPQTLFSPVIRFIPFSSSPLSSPSMSVRISGSAPKHLPLPIINLLGTPLLPLFRMLMECLDSFIERGHAMIRAI